MTAVVLVHGALHRAGCWDRVAAELERRDVAVEAVELPFTGLADDAAAAREAVERAGPGAVVCGHSYGGVVVDRALTGTTGVSHVVYLAAMLNTGTNVFGDERPAIMGAIVPDGPRVRFDDTRARAIFYADSDDDTVAAMVEQLRPMVMDRDAFTAPPPPRPAAPTTYLLCANDAALPPSVQGRLAALCDRRIEWPTDHSPFLTHPADLAEILIVPPPGR
jgi:pimeloyl-ACP methyl ester carboxylesterase